MTVVFVFKNGYELKVRCENFSLSTNQVTGQIACYEMAGISGNKPLWLDFSKILCVYRVMTDEEVSSNV